MKSGVVFFSRICVPIFAEFSRKQLSQVVMPGEEEFVFKKHRGAEKSQTPP